ncbi:MAG: DUF378 domain-containing protein [Patescibacteria group bacterium]
MKVLHVIAFLLLVIGGLNWLVLAVSGWDIGELLGGQDAVPAKAVYILVGLAAAYEVATHKARCKDCANSSPTSVGAMPTV